MAFGLLTQKFRIFKKPLTNSIKNIPRLIHVAMLLHNFCINERLEKNEPVPEPLEVRDDFTDLDLPPETYAGATRYHLWTHEDYELDDDGVADKLHDNVNETLRLSIVNFLQANCYRRQN
jgi:hypothetical protein